MTTYELLAAMRVLKDACSIAMKQNQCSVNSPMGLLYIYQEDGITMGALSKRMGVSTAAATIFCDALEKAELARREDLLSDRRKKIMLLTPMGMQVVNKALAAADVARRTLIEEQS